MSPSFNLSFHDRQEISLLSNIVSWFYELNPSAEVDGAREEAFVQGPWWKPWARKSCTDLWIIKLWALSSLVFFITRLGSQAIMEANWLMISCLLQLLQSWLLLPVWMGESNKTSSLKCFLFLSVWLNVFISTAIQFSTKLSVLNRNGLWLYKVMLI